MTKYCTKCGCENLDDANFCSEYGVPFEEYNHSPLDANVPLKIPKKYNEYNIQETSTCFNCRKDTFIQLKKSQLLSEKIVYFCTNCGLTLEKTAGSYRIADILDKNNHMWRSYKGKQFKMSDWEHIANGGLSDKDQTKQNNQIEDLKRQLVILEHKRDISIISQGLIKGEINLPSVESPAELRDNEEAYLSLGDIILSEPNVDKKASFDTSFKISKGVALKSSVKGATNAPQNKLKQIDSGTLVITNRRVIFVGSTKTVNIDLLKVLSINVFKEGVSIVRENKKKVEYFTGTDQSTINFTINGRERSLKMEGDVIRAIILGQMANL